MGDIKKGEGTIIGNAGEYLVVGELLKRGVIAAPAPRNSPGFDVLVTDGINSLNIRVKTKTEASKSWVWVCKKDGSIFKDLSDKADYTVLVDLRDQHTSPDYYIVPTMELDRRLKDIYEHYIKQPSKRGKPHSADSRMRRMGLDYPHHKDWLYEGKGAWSLVISALEATP